MSWMGKILGGAVGYMLGGALGAIAGAALGHCLDEPEYQYDGIRVRCPHCNSLQIIPDEGVYSCCVCRKDFSFGNVDTALSPEEEMQFVFFITTFAMMGKMAMADGVISQSEVAAFRNFIRAEFNFNKQGEKFAMEIFKKAAHAPEPFDEFAMQFYEMTIGNEELRIVMLEMLFNLAMADGVFDPAEEKLLLRAREIFCISHREYEAIRALFVKDTDVCYKILGCGKDDPDDVIKSNYRKLVHEYHPDRIIAKGLPPEFVELAQKKFVEIQTAFETIAAERNMK